MHYDYTGLTVEECEGFCTADGFAYAGVEYGGEVSTLISPQFPRILTFDSVTVEVLQILLLPARMDAMLLALVMRRRLVVEETDWIFTTWVLPHLLRIV